VSFNHPHSHEHDHHHHHRHHHGLLSPVYKKLEHGAHQQFHIPNSSTVTQGLDEMSKVRITKEDGG